MPNVSGMNTANYMSGGGDKAMLSQWNPDWRDNWAMSDNFFAKASYSIANGAGILGQYMMGRSVGDLSMRNIDGSSMTTTQAVGDFASFYTLFLGGEGAGSAIGNTNVSIYRVYGEGASIYGKSYSLINPKYIPFYRNFAGLPNINSGEYLLKGSIPIKNINIGRWFAAPLDGNTGGLPFELYQSYNQLFNPLVKTLKNPF